MKKAVLLAMLVTAAGGAWVALRPRSSTPESPERLLFRKELPAWSLGRARGDPAVLNRAPLLEAAKPWPAIASALTALDDAFPDKDKVKAAVATLNTAVRSAPLSYWVDPQFVSGKPYFLTYEIFGRSRWSLGNRKVEVLRVRRLDNVNIEMGLLGHAGGDQPAVLVDRLESMAIDSFAALSTPARGENEVDRAARTAWRSLAGNAAGDAPLELFAGQLERRRRAFDAMQGRINGRIQVPRPDRLLYGEAFFENLTPYGATARAGGPLLLMSDLRELRRADTALAEGEARRAFDAVVELEAAATEAHEARHALEPDDVAPPGMLLDVVGDDDLAFAAMSERELRAYLGELHDANVPPCLIAARLATIVGGASARQTPHHFSGTLLLGELSALPGEGVKAQLEAICALPVDALRARVEALSQQLYGKPFAAATREELPLVAAGTP